MWQAHRPKADEDRGWNRCHGGVPPLGRCRILAQQDQGGGFPLRGESDLSLLGPHGCPLLPWQVRSLTVTPAGAERQFGDWIVRLCFSSHAKHRRFSVILGKNALNESDPTTEQRFRVERIIVHEAFDNSEGNFRNDIGMNWCVVASVVNIRCGQNRKFLGKCFAALLKLKAKRWKCAEESSSVRTVCLPPPQQSLQPGVTCEIAGYGKERSGEEGPLSPNSQNKSSPNECLLNTCRSRPGSHCATFLMPARTILTKHITTSAHQSICNTM